MQTISREPLNNATYKQYAEITVAAITDAQVKIRTRQLVEAMMHGADHRRAVTNALCEGRAFSVIPASATWSDLFIQGCRA